ncbi:sushi domain-containing protein 5 [Engraulis encrasicolus]|uniref:sushi domain-containing protein 5 n=1 Tax=Engraulis encrasicolus TaxID=184585 RepID=UPI002FD2D207
MARCFFPLVFGALACLAIRTCQADGRVFLLEMQNVSKSGYEGARQACVAHNARLASTADLWHAILECSFSACTRGWMDGATVGTTICKGEGGSGLRTVDVKTEENVAEEETTRLDAFCIKDKDSPCGSPPTFPHTHMQSQTGLELGDELVFVCEPGYSLASGDTAFSLLCDSCGEWYGLVQLCVEDDAEAAHQDYEDKFPNEEHAYGGEEEEVVENEETHSEEGEAEGVTDGQTETEEHDAAQETTVEEEEEGGETVVEEKEEKDAGSVTVPPVSQLSQKHLFWFPSEAFHDDDHHHDDEEGDEETHLEEPDTPDQSSSSSAKDTDNTDNSDNVAGATGMEHEEKHHHGDHREDEGGDGDAGADAGADADHIEEMPTTDEALRHTEKTWLDGYPVSEEFTESTEVTSAVEKGKGGEEDVSKEHHHLVKSEEVEDVSKEHEHLTKNEEAKDMQEVSEEHDLTKSGEEVSKEEEVRDVSKENDSTNSGEVKVMVDVSEEHDPARSEEENEKERGNERATESSEETFKEELNHPDTEEAEAHPTVFINGSEVVSTEMPFHHHHHHTVEPLNIDGSDSITHSGVGPIDSVMDTTATTIIYPSTTQGFFHVTLAPDSNEVTAMAEDVTSVPFHHVTLSPDDVITAIDDLGTPVIFATVLPDDDDDDDVVTTTVSADVPVLVHDFSDLDSDRYNLTKQSMPTEDPCSELDLDTCSPSSRSTSLIAIVTVVTIVAVAGLILGAWLYRRRQLKSSHYQFNGTNTHTQNFEMQQTV